METNGQFARILHQSFEKEFPSWSMLPDFDPVKLIAGSVTRSLSAIEAQQESVLETVLDSLPSILGFEAKPAHLPRALVAMEPASSLESEVELSPELGFRLDEQGQSFLLHPVSGSKLRPYTQFRQVNTGNSVRMVFQVKGKNSKLVLHFVPDAEKNGFPVQVRDLHLTVSSIRAKKVREFNFTDILIHDTTSNLSQTGTLTFELLPSRGVLLYDDFSEVDLTVSGDQLPRGTFFANLMEGELSQRLESVSLAKLEGKAWEVIALPAEAIAAPQEIILQYPDLSSKTVALWAGDLLLARRADPARFQASFFYHSPKHSLVIPGAHRLMNDFAGAVDVRAKALLTLPTMTLTRQATLSFNPKPAWIASLTWQRHSQAAVARETEATYFQRVYTTLRQMPWQPTPGIFTTDLEAAILSAHEEVRQVEVRVDSAQKNVVIYAECATASPGSAEAKAAMSDVLNRIVPLDHQWQMASFGTLPLRLLGSLNISTGAAQANQFDETATEQMIRDVIARNFHSNRFPRTSVLTRDLIQQRITAELQRRLGGLTIEYFDLHLINPQSGQFLDRLSRPVGTHFAVETELAISFVREGSKTFSPPLETQRSQSGGVHA